MFCRNIEGKAVPLMDLQNGSPENYEKTISMDAQMKPKIRDRTIS